MTIVWTGPVKVVHVPADLKGDAYANELMSSLGSDTFPARDVATLRLQVEWDKIRHKYRLTCCSPRVDFIPITTRSKS